MRDGEMERRDVQNKNVKKWIQTKEKEGAGERTNDENQIFDGRKFLSIDFQRLPSVR